MGVVAPNGVGLTKFEQSLKTGKSGISFLPELKSKNFGCCVAGVPQVPESLINDTFSPLQLRNFSSSGILYGCIAGRSAWHDAGLKINDENPDYDSGCIFGAGASGTEKMAEVADKVASGNIKRLSSNTVAQTMTSGISAYLSGMIGLGNQVTTNSSACATGTESILMAFERIQSGKATRMIAGSCSDHGPHLWGPFDALRVLTRKHADEPERASRPMSDSASGFVPGSGAGALALESLGSARSRGARIYCEILGGHVNCGSQRNGGSMTAPNSIAVQRCITEALNDAQISAASIDVIHGHLTATKMDADEIENWVTALNYSHKNIPFIQAPKSIFGHCIGAAGTIESVAAVLGLTNDYVFPNLNCEDLHPKIEQLVPSNRIPTKLIEKAGLNIAVKASFGFGDVNCCIVFKKYEDG